MSKDPEKLAESAWREGFRDRVIQARGPRTQGDMAYLLGLSSANTYGKYEGSRKSIMPVRLLPKFCKICGVTLEWLIDGDVVTVKTKQKLHKRKVA